MFGDTDPSQNGRPHCLKCFHHFHNFITISVEYIVDLYIFLSIVRLSFLTFRSYFIDCTLSVSIDPLVLYCGLRVLMLLMKGQFDIGVYCLWWRSADCNHHILKMVTNLFQRLLTSIWNWTCFQTSYIPRAGIPLFVRLSIYLFVFKGYDSITRLDYNRRRFHFSWDC